MRDSPRKPFAYQECSAAELDIVLHALTVWENKDLSRIGVRGDYSLYCVHGENEALSNEASASMD